MHARLIIGTVAAALIAAPVFAQTASDHASHHADSAAKAAPAIDGEVRKVDKGAGKLTIRHAEIPTGKTADPSDASLAAQAPQTARNTLADCGLSSAPVALHILSRRQSRPSCPF